MSSEASVIVVRAGEQHVEVLLKLAVETFTETFASSNSKENLDHYMQQAFTPARLLEELRHPESEFYLASIHNQPVGYLKLNVGQAQVEMKDANSLEIERIYVLQAWHGKQIGQVLVDLALQRARAYRVDFVWLGVWEHNYRAMRFYERNGFRAFSQHIFQVGDDPQTDILMRREM